MSCFPSPLKSPTAIELGSAPTAKVVGAPKLPSPSPNMTATSSENGLQLAMSCRPSPLKSPTATETGSVPGLKLVGALKPPAPSPNRMDTWFAPLTTTARSCLPSPLKSPTATSLESPIPARLVALKLPAPSPNRIDTKLEPLFATARPCLKSPTAVEKGRTPTPKLAAAAKLTGLHVAGVVTVKVKVFVVVNPLLPNALTLTVYTPAGCASVTRTTPVAASPSSLPLKLVEVETFILVVLVGAASGVTVVLPLN